MKLDIKKVVQTDAKILSINIKVCDMFCAELIDAQGAIIHEQEDGYVPKFMPGEHYGDYIMLDIDIDTGKIVNWEDIDPSDIMHWINETQES